VFAQVRLEVGIPLPHLIILRISLERIRPFNETAAESPRRPAAPSWRAQDSILVL
jgi:hypothetical protein